MIIAAVSRIESAWNGLKLTIRDSKSFTDHVHLVAWFPESFSVYGAVDFARFVPPFFLLLFKFFGVSVHDNNISTFAVCSICRVLISFSFAAVDYVTPYMKRPPRYGSDLHEMWIVSTTKSLPFKLPPRRGKTIKQSFSSSPSTCAAYDIFPVVIFSLRLRSIDHKSSWSGLRWKMKAFSCSG